MKALRQHGVLALTLAVSLLGVAHFFERFPNGWDQAEYAWCVRSGNLPHSPYILFFLAGRFVHLFLDPPAALSFLSAVSGLLCVLLFYLIQLRLFSAGGRAMAAGSSILMGFSYLFIRQAATQEVYAFQTVLVLLSVYLLLVHLKHAAAYAGVAYGCALAAHTASLFLLPAMVYALLVLRPTKERSLRVRSLLTWLVALGVTCAAFSVLIYGMLPVAQGGKHLSEVLSYLRGISEPLPSQWWTAPGFWSESLHGLFVRLSSLNVPQSRQPWATGPVGMSAVHLLAAGVGMVLCLWSRTRQGLFWLIYLMPYTIYEVLLGANLDYGIYLPLILPAVWSFTAFVVLVPFTGGTRAGGRVVTMVLRSVAILALVAPSVFLIVRHWSDPDEDAIAHYSPSTLGAIWMATNLPQNALVIQARKEWNANILPYYAQRQHVMRDGPLMVFAGRGKFTPMNVGSYELLTTGFLQSVIASGRPVYAFDEDPLSGNQAAILDPSEFEWEAAAAPDLGLANLVLPVNDRVRDSLFRGKIVLYRAKLRQGL